MADEETKKRATIAFIERFNQLLTEADEDSKKMIEFKGNWEETFEKANKYYFEHKKKLDILENDLFVPYKLADRIDIARCWQELNRHGRNLFAKITNILGLIKNKVCDKCSKSLSMDNCYVYFHETKSVQKWILEETQNFTSEDFRTLFCSEDCYKQSIYYQDETKQEQTNQPTNIERERERERERESKSSSKPQQTEPEEEYQEPSFCSSCANKILPNQTYFYNSKENDQNKLCSEECYLSFYGELCLKCKNKFLKENLFAPDEKYSHYLLCSNCLEKEKLKQKETKSQPDKYLFTETSCKFCLIKLPNQRFFPVCDQDDCRKKFWEEGNKKKVNNNLNLDNEQNRTEQNRTEQNRTEQNRTEQNASNELTKQINNLQKEINQLEKQTNPNQNLLNLKKQELVKLENKLKVQEQKNEPNNNLNLYLGIGMGILGLGLIGLIVYLITEKKK